MELLRYRKDDGGEPFTDWLTGLTDLSAAARIRVRLRRLEAGNFGDAKSVGDGVFELRLDFGPGYRVYFGRQGRKLVVLLCGGDKSFQSREIDRAKVYWLDWKKRR